MNSREGGVRDAIRNYVREAPRTIERASLDSERLTPLLARDRTLPADTVAALRERTVVAERGRLSGPAAAEIASRGALVDRSRPATTGTTIGRGFTAEKSVPDPIARDRGAVAGGERSLGQGRSSRRDRRHRGQLALARRSDRRRGAGSVSEGAGVRQRESERRRAPRFLAVSLRRAAGPARDRRRRPGPSRRRAPRGFLARARVAAGAAPRIGRARTRRAGAVLLAAFPRRARPGSAERGGAAALRAAPRRARSLLASAAARGETRGKAGSRSGSAPQPHVERPPQPAPQPAREAPAAASAPRPGALSRLKSLSRDLLLPRFSPRPRARRFF